MQWENLVIIIQSKENRKTAYRMCRDSFSFFFHLTFYLLHTHTQGERINWSEVVRRLNIDFILIFMS